MKVAVYAICKNEARFAARWMASMGEADGVYVLDTGSTDGTAERLRALGAVVAVEEIIPWRFDAGRNRSLALVPEDADICVCTDLDEVFRPGWRAALEGAWGPDTVQASYRYTWSFRPDGGEDTVFWSEKIHSRQGWRWVHPVHEVLERLPGFPPGGKAAAPGVQLDHHPDPAKSRGQYLPLLELSVEEAPGDDRNTHHHSLWSLCRSSMTSRLPRGSSPAAGSSRTSTSGRVTMTPAMATRRFCPPESSNGDFSLSSPKSRPTTSSAACTAESIS